MLTHQIELLADAALTKSQNRVILALNSDAEGLRKLNTET